MTFLGQPVPLVGANMYFLNFIMWFVVK
jgi:hypothetical protein